MSGGGTHVSRGLMSSKLAAETVAPEVMRRYEKESEDASAQLDAAQARLREFEANVEGLTNRIPQINMALQKIELDIQTGAKRVAEAEKRVRELKCVRRLDLKYTVLTYLLSPRTSLMKVTSLAWRS